MKCTYEGAYFKWLYSCKSVLDKNWRVCLSVWRILVCLSQFCLSSSLFFSLSIYLYIYLSIYLSIHHLSLSHTSHATFFECCIWKMSLLDRFWVRYTMKTLKKSGCDTVGVVCPYFTFFIWISDSALSLSLSLNCFEVKFYNINVYFFVFLIF